MGTVFEAEDEAQGRRVALKLISRGYVASDDAIRRFRQEGRLASAVTHPRCVFVLAVDEDAGRPYIVMELMPGTTLQTLVRERGPLPIAEAITKILDVVEGLQEVHKLGMIHRDVKPSNCFLDAEGRVKVGDFGLSKSLQGGEDLTRTGSFIGSPLYASPEQIKRDPVDVRTDVYSLAATLYYLLVGHPPVKAKDAAEALARIVSESAPPLRRFRSEIPRALEAVVLRGLEREGDRRWRDLDEFRSALLPFVPSRLSYVGIGLRLLAFGFDLGFFLVLSWAMFGVAMISFSLDFWRTSEFFRANSAWYGWSERILWVLYFWVLEGWWGASLGKRLLELRVCETSTGGPPGMVRGALRAITFYALTGVPADVFDVYVPAAHSLRQALGLLLSGVLVRILGFLTLTSTMRSRSGFRGIHEWISGTRVVRLRRGRRPIGSGLHHLHLLRFRGPGREAIPLRTSVEQLGPYRIRGAVQQEDSSEILLGEDSQLERSVWVVVRPRETPPLTEARRNLSRVGRPRWINAGEQVDRRWDAFIAPTGLPLPDYVGPAGLSWADALPILQDLADELDFAVSDGTLPAILTLDRIWIRTDGRAQLIDVLTEDQLSEDRSFDRNPEPETNHLSADPETTDMAECRAIAFLRDAARLALEGSRSRTVHPPDPGRDGLQPRREPAQTASRRIEAAVPEHARILLDRLAGLRRPTGTLSDLRQELEAAGEQPVQVSRIRRVVHLAVHGFFLFPGLMVMFLLSYPETRVGPFLGSARTVAAVPLLWILWSLLTWGGLSAPLVGIALVDSRGRPVRRLACALRSALVWLPLAAVLIASLWAQDFWTDQPWIGWTLWAAGIMLLVVDTTIALLFPDRGPHDVLSGTTLVPR
jgi:hypothetical protein